MPGPFDKDSVDPDTIWDWLLIPNPPNEDAAEKLIAQQTSDEGTSLGGDFDTPTKVWTWDYVNRGTAGVMPKFEG